ncbi:DUF7542 family protein [Halogranum gelatinilyticum]|nr:hypothetical protein [Halogranum gelatinilyticum]
MASHYRTFHVVCRDCQTESLVDSEERAREFVDEHTADSDHTVDFKRVA